MPSSTRNEKHLLASGTSIHHYRTKDGHFGQYFLDRHRIWFTVVIMSYVVQEGMLEIFKNSTQTSLKGVKSRNRNTSLGVIRSARNARKYNFTEY